MIRTKRKSRNGVSAVETSMIIAMLLGGLLLVIGSMSGKFDKMMNPADIALRENHRAELVVKQASTVTHRSNLDEPLPESNLLVGLGIPTVVLAVVGGVTYLVVKP